MKPKAKTPEADKFAYTEADVDSLVFENGLRRTSTARAKKSSKVSRKSRAAKAKVTAR